jgi:formylglycine-generating enzyme required for sulfatase activity
VLRKIVAFAVASTTAGWLAVAAATAEDPSPSAGEPAPATEIVHPVDRAIMVYVPSGAFTMGLGADEAKKLAASLGETDYHKFAAEEWFPQRRVYVEGFFIDKFEVTNELWNKYTKATGYHAKLSKGPKEAAEGKLDVYPAGQITWAEAQQYANWARKRLPYEAQWEKAARGTDGRWYPWGNEPPTKERGVFPAHQGPRTIYDRVGSRPAGASPYGAMDMSGNMYEWTCEFMEPYPNNPEAERMLSYTGHQFGCLRGGSFYHAMHALSCPKRFGFRPDETYYHVGFRTVWEPPAGYFKSADFTKAKETVPARKAEMEKLQATGLQHPPLNWTGG